MMSTLLGGTRAQTKPAKFVVFLVKGKGAAVLAARQFDLLRPYDPDKMTTHQVDPRVGNVKVNEPGLCNAWTCPPNSA
jgi:hypothetical protein